MRENTSVLKQFSIYVYLIYKCFNYSQYDKKEYGTYLCKRIIIKTIYTYIIDLTIFYYWIKLYQDKKGK